MQISSIASHGYTAAQGNGGFAKIRQSFEDLGSALDAGNLSDAQAALAKLEENAPAAKSNGKNPMSEKMAALSEALDSGDLEGAQKAYASVKEAMASRPSGAQGSSGKAGGGAPPAGGGTPASTTEASSSSKTYDVRDTNEDGKVSLEEEQAYQMKQMAEVQQTSTTGSIDSDRGIIDALA